MSDVHILAIDLAKRSFQVCATDRGGAVLFNRTVSRAKLMQMLDAHEPCIVKPQTEERKGGLTPAIAANGRRWRNGHPVASRT